MSGPPLGRHRRSRPRRTPARTFTASTDADGRFELSLSPGTYEVTIDAASTPPTAEPQTVTVEEGSFTEIEVVRRHGHPVARPVAAGTGATLAHGLGRAHAGARCIPETAHVALKEAIRGPARTSVPTPRPHADPVDRRRGRRVLRRAVARPAPRDGGGDQPVSSSGPCSRTGRIRNAEILEGDQVVRGKLTDGTEYVVTFTAATLPTSIATELREADVPIHATSAEAQRRSCELLYYVLPILLLAGLLLWMMNRAQGGGGRVMQFGRSRHKTVGKDQPKTTFKDVAGVDEAIEELEEVKEYLPAPVEVPGDGREDPPGRPPVRSPRHRQDAPRAGGRGRGGRAVLLDQRVGLRRDVRRRRRRPGP